MLGDVRLTGGLVLALGDQLVDDGLMPIDALSLDAGQHEAKGVTT